MSSLVTRPTGDVVVRVRVVLFHTLVHVLPFRVVVVVSVVHPSGAFTGRGAAMAVVVVTVRKPPGKPGTLTVCFDPYAVFAPHRGSAVVSVAMIVPSAAVAVPAPVAAVACTDSLPSGRTTFARSVRTPLSVVTRVSCAVVRPVASVTSTFHPPVISVRASVLNAGPDAVFASRSWSSRPSAS